MKNKEKIKPKGIHIFHIFRTTTERARQLQLWIEKVTFQRTQLLKYKKGTATNEFLKKELAKLSEQYQFCIEEMRRVFKVREYVVENITTTVGRAVSAEVLAGTYGGATGAVTHTALGDDNTAPAVGQTTLVSETSRKALSDGNTTSATALLETFFSTSEAVDTHEEYGFFIDGTVAADSGVMFNRFTEQTVKSNTESMNVQSSILFSDA